MTRLINTKITARKLVPLFAITAAMGAVSAPGALASTAPDGRGAVDEQDSTAQPAYAAFDGAMQRRPAPRPTPRIKITCDNVFGSIYICQIKFSGGSSEYVCDTVSKICIKQ